MTAAAKRAPPSDLKPLTALRFFAAIWVVSYHYWPSLTLNAMPTWEGKGYLGVELFFVLSGFILSHVYLQAAGEKRMSYGSFLWARLSRIYPMHLATLFGLMALGLVTLALGLNGGDKLMVWSSLPGQIFLVQAWGLAPHGGWNHPAWSISAEWFAYLTFPVFAAAAWALRNRPLVAVGLAAAFVVVINAVFERIAGFKLTEATILWGALRIVPCFALGCAAYLAFRRHALTDKNQAHAAVLGSVLLVVLGAALGLADPLMVLLFGLLIFSLGSLTTAGSTLLTAKPMVWLGEVSFAIYMVCIPWMLVVTHGANKVLHTQGEMLPAPVWVVMFATVVPVAALAHHLIERPARTAMRALEQRQGQRRKRLRFALRQAVA
jgi:peptidoglycan/LPS O-acetylase OafA/YrhL